MGTLTASLVPTDPKQLEAILQRARSGDEKALPAVREILKSPMAVDRLGGDLAWQAEQSLIRAAAGKNLSLREALTRKLELLRAELAGPAPTPLERLLVERVAACWLQLHYADMLHAQQMAELSMVQGEYLQRTRDRAHKRYLSAIKALSLVRKLAVPVLQVNIAKRQVNLAGAVPVLGGPPAPAGGSGFSTPQQGTAAPAQAGLTPQPDEPRSAL
jgi:hypothetical protein